MGPSLTPGDSGSGILDQASYTNGKPKVIAIATLSSWGADGKRNGGEGVRASSQKAFLIAGAQEAATAGGYPLPAWAVGTMSSSDAGVAMDAGAITDGAVAAVDGAVAAVDAAMAPTKERGCSMSASPHAERWTLLLLVGLAGTLARALRSRQTQRIPRTST
jgi:hypothetical protein